MQLQRFGAQAGHARRPAACGMQRILPGAARCSELPSKQLQRHSHAGWGAAPLMPDQQTAPSRLGRHPPRAAADGYADASAQVDTLVPSTFALTKVILGAGDGGGLRGACSAVGALLTSGALHAAASSGDGPAAQRMDTAACCILAIQRANAYLQPLLCLRTAV